MRVFDLKFYVLAGVLILITILCAIFIGRIFGDLFEVRPSSGFAIADESACKKAGGEWKPIGKSPKPVCNVVTGDAGSNCTGPDDCQGVCLARLTPNQEHEAIAKGFVVAKGKCSPRRFAVGCHFYVEDGKASAHCED